LRPGVVEPHVSNSLPASTRPCLAGAKRGLIPPTLIQVTHLFDFAKQIHDRDSRHMNGGSYGASCWSAASDSPRSPARHGRACPGHPRVSGAENARRRRGPRRLNIGTFWLPTIKQVCSADLTEGGDSSPPRSRRKPFSFVRFVSLVVNRSRDPLAVQRDST
jgi:hypothetical protein